MTDYKNLKLIATSNPHIRSNETTQTIMRDVVVAMLPALVFACVRFGARLQCPLWPACSGSGCTAR